MSCQQQARNGYVWSKSKFLEGECALVKKEIFYAKRVASSRNVKNAPGRHPIMSEIVDIFVPLDALDEPLRTFVARVSGRSESRIGPLRVVRRSLDARKDRRLGYRMRVEIAAAGESLAPVSSPTERPSWPVGVSLPRVVIVGSGPAGSWAALRLAEAGVASTILERGKPVGPRRRDIANIHRGQLDPTSNYCFGEGGAGTYSDGKLYTRSKDRLEVAAVLADLVALGAPTDIEVDARAHIGSNRLPKLLEALRVRLQTMGVRYQFECAFTGIRVEHGRIHAVETNQGEMPADIVVLAPGHSARDVYAWAAAAKVALQRKDIAVGVRLEHPQSIIDRLQYGRAAGHAKLPPAFYELHAAGAGRSVFSFCMCPGGWIVPAATEPNGLVVNGMSLAKRNSPFANAALVVPVTAADFGPEANGFLAGIDFQRRIEEAAFERGGGGFRAPAQRLVDFLGRRSGESLPRVSYRPGVQHARLDDLFPEFITTALREGLSAIGRRLPGFVHDEAVLVAAETRTSSPVRIVRDSVTLESPTLAGLYPAGEGAGYAGGIVSSAMDGARVADAIVQRGIG
jgi:uncharacterized protein